MENQEIYIKYFNYGYALRQHEPEVLEKLLNTKPESPEVLQGLEDGKVQYENEMKLMRLMDDRGVDELDM